jgi:hypothetical protein
MANMVQAVCTAAMAMAARWLSVGALAELIASRSSAGGLPLVGQQLLDAAVQLRRYSGEHIFQVSPGIVPVEFGRLQQGGFKPE